jgi:cytosolic carboxypeptidase protein 6
MKVGRNLARSLLEYYRFTSILPIPPLTEILSKRKGRPKTHRPRHKFKNIYPNRPKTTRENAPINYKDLSIYYDSDTSAEYSSPVRYPFHSNFMLQHHRLRQSHLDPYSISTLKLGTLDLSPKSRKKKEMTSTASEMSPSKVEVMNMPPKPYLSIIDFNLLTRGGLEEATSRSPEKICPHHYQKLKSKTTDKIKAEKLRNSYEV